jgi:hypothetical protein
MRLLRPFLMIMLLLPLVVACDRVVELLTFDGLSSSDPANNGPTNDGPSNDGLSSDDPMVEAGLPELTDDVTLTPTATATAEPTVTPTSTPEPTPTMAFDLPEPGHQMVLTDSLAEGERHHYNFVATDLGTITAVVTPFDGFDVVLEIIDGNDELLLLVDESFGEERLTFTGPEPLGRYALVVTGFEDEAGSYRLALNTNAGVTLFLVDGDEVLSLLGLASRLEYAVALNVGQTVTAVANPDPDLDLTLQIYDLDENLLLEVNENGAGEPETLTYSSLATGVYFLVARTDLGSIGQFTLTMTVD